MLEGEGERTGRARDRDMRSVEAGGVGMRTERIYQESNPPRERDAMTRADHKDIFVTHAPSYASRTINNSYIPKY